MVRGFNQYAPSESRSGGRRRYLPFSLTGFFDVLPTALRLIAVTR
jgi:hypothetical protein